MPSSLKAWQFWLPYFVLPLEVLAILYGSWWMLVVVIVLFHLTAILDAVFGLNFDNANPDTDPEVLIWHRAGIMIWPAVQFFLIYGAIWSALNNPNLTGAEPVLLMVIIGIVTGGTGIVYAHEMMHQTNRQERWLADILMAMVLYGHFRSEHLLVHHVKVGTPDDAVTARYNEGLSRFYLRVLPGSLRSAWLVEAEMQARAGRKASDLSNPFWRYGALALGFVLLAGLVGGWAGIGLFCFQALVAILLLEAINYVEHYGLVRRRLENGKYEPQRAHHSWNSNHRVTNYLLINLQRHADHHARPDRRFPLLQSLDEGQAPHLPYGYTIMALMAYIPPLWRRVMNKRVRKWRADYYPDITNWKKSA